MNITAQADSVKIEIKGENSLIVNQTMWASDTPYRGEEDSPQAIKVEGVVSRSGIHFAFWYQGIEYDFSFVPTASGMKLIQKVSAENPEEMIYGDTINRETVSTVIPDARILIEAAKKEVERLEAQGWTREDFAKSFASLLEGKDGKDN